jgi:hypothetical protein
METILEFIGTRLTTMQPTIGAHRFRINEIRGSRRSPLIV